MNQTPESWLDRSLPKLSKKFSLDDYPNHHFAEIRCMNCGNVFLSLYPVAANPLRLECAGCGAQDSEVARYLKFIHVQ